MRKVYIEVLSGNDQDLHGRMVKALLALSRLTLGCGDVGSIPTVDLYIFRPHKGFLHF